MHNLWMMFEFLPVACFSCSVVLELCVSVLYCVDRSVTCFGMKLTRYVNVTGIQRKKFENHFF
jgi:hypothetical protein